MEATYKRLRINLKVERGLTFTNTHDLPYIVSIYLRAEDLRVYARKNYATVEINPKGREKEEWVGGRTLRYTLFMSHTIKPNSNRYILTSKSYEKVTDRDSKFICCCVGCVDNVSFVARRLETK